METVSEYETGRLCWIYILNLLLVTGLVKTCLVEVNLYEVLIFTKLFT